MTVVIGLALTVYAAVAGSMIHFEDYLNPPRIIPAWVRFSWYFSRIWWMGGWMFVLPPVFFISMVWINERMRQREKKQSAEVTPSNASP